jgi:hypothetical protein
MLQRHVHRTVAIIKLLLSGPDALRINLYWLQALNIGSDLLCSWCLYGRCVRRKVIAHCNSIIYNSINVYATDVGKALLGSRGVLGLINSCVRVSGASTSLWRFRKFFKGVGSGSLASSSSSSLLSSSSSQSLSSFVPT